MRRCWKKNKCFIVAKCVENKNKKIKKGVKYYWKDPIYILSKQILKTIEREMDGAYGRKGLFQSK